MKCNLCPRGCNADRSAGKGVCGTYGAVLSRVGTHVWEEPCISGSRGSGTIFFAGCNLKCRFCQNYDVTVRPHGSKVDARRLADVILYVAGSGVHNVNLVTAAHVSDVVAQALSLCKHRLKVPVVYNTSSYESVRALKNLEGLVDVYLPDMKFVSPALSKRYTGREDYFEKASEAISFMAKKPLRMSEEGKMLSGLIVRHLVMPLGVNDSLAVLRWFRKEMPDTAYLSLMSQYTPFGDIARFPELKRPVTAREYRQVTDAAFALGIERLFVQKRDSSGEQYIPRWDY